VTATVVPYDVPSVRDLGHRAADERDAPQDAVGSRSGTLEACHVREAIVDGEAHGQDVASPRVRSRAIEAWRGNGRA
jgi:hypothetical protein